MTATKLVISLNDDEIAELQEIAKSQRRSPAQQAEVLVLAGMGMAIERSGGHRSRWTNRELGVLRERTDLSDAGIGALLGRTEDAVAARRHRLGIRKYTLETKEDKK